VLRRLVALWEEKTTNVSMVLLGFILLLLCIGFVVEKVFLDIKEMERMNLIENTKTKFIEMALFASGIFMNRRVDSFGGLSMLILVVVFCNLHWLSSDRTKEHLMLNKLDGMFLRLMVFKLGFFLLVYAIFHILVNVKGVIFKILWFEVAAAHPGHLHHDQAAARPGHGHLLLLLPADRALRLRYQSDGQVHRLDLQDCSLRAETICVFLPQ
jgi:hypothetical protein